jgi:S-adenosylmethionine decarboxylase
MGLNTTARHLVVEYHGCDKELLNDQKRIERLMRLAAHKAQATVVGAMFHAYSPQGVSGVVVVEESHFSIHTWPEYAYAAVDCYTCGDCQPEAAHKFLQDELRAKETELMVLSRGQNPPRPSIKIKTHKINEVRVETS